MSYCTRCGKQINYDSPICAECVEELRAAKEAETVVESETATVVEESTPSAEPTHAAEPAYTPTPAAQPAPTASPVMRGFGKALTATLLSLLAYVFSVIAVAIGASGEGGFGFIMFFAVPAAVVSLVLGIGSIKTFCASTERPKPIPALVLGIFGVCWSGISTLIDVLALALLLTY